MAPSSPSSMSSSSLSFKKVPPTALETTDFCSAFLGSCCAKSRSKSSRRARSGSLRIQKVCSVTWLSLVSSLYQYSPWKVKKSSFFTTSYYKVWHTVWHYIIGKGIGNWTVDGVYKPIRISFFILFWLGCWLNSSTTSLQIMEQMEKIQKQGEN